MPELAVDCTITRTELLLPILDLNDAPYKVIRRGLGIGGTVWKRHTVGSPFVHGDLTVHQVKAHSTVDIAVRVSAASDAALWTAIDAAVAAVEQTTYTVTFTIDGQQRSYTCEAADYALDGEAIDTIELFSHRQVLRIAAPRSPVPLVGRI